MTQQIKEPHFVNARTTSSREISFNPTQIVAYNFMKNLEAEFCNIAKEFFINLFGFKNSRFLLLSGSKDFKLKLFCLQLPEILFSFLGIRSSCAASIRPTPAIQGDSGHCSGPRQQTNHLYNGRPAFFCQESDMKCSYLMPEMQTFPSVFFYFNHY